MLVLGRTLTLILFSYLRGVLRRNVDRLQLSTTRTMSALQTYPSSHSMVM